MKIRIEYQVEPPETPVSYFVHKAPDGEYWHRTAQKELVPPMPPKVLDRGYPLWILEHRARELHFGSPEEMSHVASILGQKIMITSREYGKQMGGESVNSNWVSRLHKSWLPWDMRQQIVQKLNHAINGI